MKREKKKLPKSQVQLTVEIENDVLGKYRQGSLAALSAKANIPGFRKGHIPEKILVEHYGEAMILSEMAERAIPDLLTKAMIEEKITPLILPEVSVESLNPFRFTAIITSFPEITLEKWEDASVPKKKIVVSEKEKEKVIDELRERFIERKPVDRPAKDGDFVEISFFGKTPDGVPLEGTESKMHPVVLGKGQLLSDFEKELIGMKTGEEKTFTMTFPKDYGAQHLSGKPVVFDINMVGVYEQVLPMVDDAFAQKIFGETASAESMRLEIEKILLEKAENEERSRRENELLEIWNKKATMDLPDIFVQEEMTNMKEFLKDRVQQMGFTWEQHLANMKKTEEDFEKENWPEAEKRSRERLIIGYLLDLSEISIPEKNIQHFAHELFHEELPPHTHHNHDHNITKNSELWKRAEHRLRVEALFDRFLGIQKKKESSEK